MESGSRLSASGGRLSALRVPIRTPCRLKRSWRSSGRIPALLVFFGRFVPRAAQAENELTATDAFWLGLIDTLSHPFAGCEFSTARSSSYL
jgi:hypothetical protein